MSPKPKGKKGLQTKSFQDSIFILSGLVETHKPTFSQIKCECFVFTLHGFGGILSACGVTKTINQVKNHIGLDLEVLKSSSDLICV